nr:hypothetical protein GCM10020241_60480 [Streptoalloteichus tenebrarius]
MTRALPRRADDPGRKKENRRQEGVGRSSRTPRDLRDLLAAPGHPVDPGLRRDMEAALGHDFGRVRVHTDQDAAALADLVGADAVTVGQDIFFARGAFQPGTVAGRRLLAHELLHTVQVPDPSGALVAGREAGAVSLPQEAVEREAERIAGAEDGQRTEPRERANSAAWLRYAAVDADRMRTEHLDPATLVDRLVAGVLRSLRGDPTDASGRVRAQLARFTPELRRSVVERLETRLPSGDLARLRALTAEAESGAGPREASPVVPEPVTGVVEWIENLRRQAEERRHADTEQDAREREDERDQRTDGAEPRPEPGREPDDRTEPGTQEPGAEEPGSGEPAEEPAPGEEPGPDKDVEDPDADKDKDDKDDKDDGEDGKDGEDKKKDEDGDQDEKEKDKKDKKDDKKDEDKDKDEDGWSEEERRAEDEIAAQPVAQAPGALGAQPPPGQGPPAGATPVVDAGTVEPTAEVGRPERAEAVAQEPESPLAHHGLLDRLGVEEPPREEEKPLDLEPGADTEVDVPPAEQTSDEERDGEPGPRRRVSGPRIISPRAISTSPGSPPPTRSRCRPMGHHRARPTRLLSPRRLRRRRSSGSGRSPPVRSPNGSPNPHPRLRSRLPSRNGHPNPRRRRTFPPNGRWTRRSGRNRRGQPLILGREVSRRSHRPRRGTVTSPPDQRARRGDQVFPEPPGPTRPRGLAVVLRSAVEARSVNQNPTWPRPALPAQVVLRERKSRSRVRRWARPRRMRRWKRAAVAAADLPSRRRKPSRRAAVPEEAVPWPPAVVLRHRPSSGRRPRTSPGRTHEPASPPSASCRRTRWSLLYPLWTVQWGGASVRSAGPSRARHRPWSVPPARPGPSPVRPRSPHPPKRPRRVGNGSVPKEDGSSRSPDHTRRRARIPRSGPPTRTWRETRRAGSPTATSGTSRTPSTRFPPPTPRCTPRSGPRRDSNSPARATPRAATNRRRECGRPRRRSCPLAGRRRHSRLARTRSTPTCQGRP